MRKKKIKKVVRRFMYLNVEKNNILFNFRNNVTIKGCYLSLRWLDVGSYPMGRTSRQCIAVPIRYKSKFAIGDIVLFKQKAKYNTTIFNRELDKKRKASYYKITAINWQEFFDGLEGPFFVVYLDIELLNNLEFLSAIGDLQKNKKKRGQK